LKDIQDEEALFQSKKRRKALREAAKQQEVAQPPSSDQTEETKRDLTKYQVESLGGIKFY
jgi:hypothetical protein